MHIPSSRVRVAIRTLSRHRAFTVIAVLSLAVAIALNTTMYSVLDALINPYINAREPENVYRLQFFANDQRRFTPAMLERALRVKARGFTGVTGTGFYPGFTQTLIENGTRYRRARPAIVRSNYFELLGTIPEQGRLFAPSDSAESARVAVISDRLAAKLFPDESPVGRSISVDGDPYTVIGQVTQSFVFWPLADELWILEHSRAMTPKPTLIRLRSGVDTNVAKAELGHIARQLALEMGDDPKSTGFILRPINARQFKLAQFHFALFGAVAAVLLVACANLANLQLARGLARSRELALRSAVGASRGQLVRLLLLESSLLAVLGLALGVILTLWGNRVIKASVPPYMGNYVIAPQTSWRMLVFAAAAAIVCLFLVGLLPAMRVSRVEPDVLLKAGNGTGAQRAHRRRYGAMLIAQIGLALPVLIGAIAVMKVGLVYRSRDFLVRTIYGYDPSPLVSATVWYPYDTTGTLGAAGVIADVSARARMSPGVLEAAGSFGRQPVRRTVSVDDENGAVREEPAPQWSYTIVSPSYFRTFGRAMQRGRDFHNGEFDRSVIVDEGTARYLWGSHDPVGRAIKFGDGRSNEPWYRVIGVVGDQRDTATLRRRDYSWSTHMGSVYRVVAPDDSMPFRGSAFYNSVSVYARVSGNTELAAVRLQRLLRGTAGNRTVTVVPLDADWIRAQRVRQDFVASLFGTFALIGVGLVAVGVYGIVAHTVTERKRELAVRVSLGATARDVLHAVLREGNVLVLAGVAIGLFFTKHTIWWLGIFLDDEVGYDAVLMAFIAAFLFAVAVAAAAVPAWRATRIDPVEALRHE